MTSPIVWEGDDYFNDCYWGLVGGKLKYEILKGETVEKFWLCITETIGEFATAETLEEAKRRCEEHLGSVR
jgi:hypothetical protein